MMGLARARGPVLGSGGRAWDVGRSSLLLAVVGLVVVFVFSRTSIATLALSSSPRPPDGDDLLAFLDAADDLHAVALADADA